MNQKYIIFMYEKVLGVLQLFGYSLVLKQIQNLK